MNGEIVSGKLIQASVGNVSAARFTASPILLRDSTSIKFGSARFSTIWLAYVVIFCIFHMLTTVNILECLDFA